MFLTGQSHSNKELYDTNKSAYNILQDVSHEKCVYGTVQDGGATVVKSKASENKEIEYRFYDVNVTLLRRTLKKLNAKLIQKKIIMPLVVFNHPTSKKDSYIRIRHEGSHISMTSKTDLGNKFVTEYEVKIDSFEQGVKLLLSLGCTKKYYVEKLRETWEYESVEIVFDSYPGTSEYIEIEAATEKAIKKVVAILNLPSKPDKNRDQYNDEYGAPKDRKIEGDLTIDGATEKFGKIITKNKEKFNRIVKEQKKYYKGSDARAVKKVLDLIA